MTPEVVDYIKDIIFNLTNYEILVNSFMENTYIDTSVAAIIINSGTEDVSKIDAKMTGVFEFIKKNADLKVALQNRIFFLIIFSAIVVFFISSIILIVLSYVISNHISNSIKKTVAVLNKISSGNFSEELESDLKDEIGDIINFIEMMRRSLSSVIFKVKEIALKSQGISHSIAQSTSVSSLAVDKCNEPNYFIS